MSIVYWFRFPNENQANDLRDDINALSGFPVVGRNAKTGILQPDNQTTDNWVIDPILCTDSNWGFKAPSKDRIDTIALTPQENTNMHNFYDANAVEFDPSWIASEDP